MQENDGTKLFKINSESYILYMYLWNVHFKTNKHFSLVFLILGFKVFLVSRVKFGWKDLVYRSCPYMV